MGFHGALFLWIILDFKRGGKYNIPISTIKKETLTLCINEGNNKSSSKWRVAVYFVMFVLSILVVVRVLPWYVVTALILVIGLLMEREAVKGADYTLLLTFIAFFIFIGNMGELPAVKNMLSELVEGREVIVSVISSQAVSNVPAALLLSGFTSNYEGLIIGTNLGGLGTLIASMASLISYKQVANEKGNIKGKYFISFTVWNVVFLAALMVVYFVIEK